MLYDILCAKGGNELEYTLIIDNTKTESLILTVHERNAFVEFIEELLSGSDTVTAYRDDEILLVPTNSISCFFTDKNKVCINVNGEKFHIKQKLYMLEETLGNSFIKINQGCIVNIRHVKKFTASVGGSVKVVLQNGFEDHISRRELRNVKRRFGI